MIYKYQNGRFIKVSNNSIIGKAYDIKTYRKYLFVTATDESNHMSLYRYNGLSWTKINTTNKNAAAPKMIVSNGILYYVYSSNTADGNTIIYRYDTKIKDFVSEGEYVDGYSNSQSFVVTWVKKSYSGYQIRYSLKPSMASSKSVTITNASTISKKISRLKSKKKYYVQIRTYKIVNGKKYYSEWSGKKSVVIV